MDSAGRTDLIGGHIDAVGASSDAGRGPHAPGAAAQVAARRSFFRQEAVDYYRRAGEHEGDVLHVSPEWARRTYWVLAAFFAAALTYGAVARVAEYASGAAWVRTGPPHGMTAPDARASAEVTDRHDGAETVVAFFPARARAALQVGRPLRVVLDGLPGSGAEAVIEFVDDKVLGPAGVARQLGPELADGARRVETPAVYVRARLATSGFMVSGRQLVLDDGLAGRAELRVRSDRVLVVLIPGLRRVTSHVELERE